MSSLQRTPGRFTERRLYYHKIANRKAILGHFGSLARTKSVLGKSGIFLSKAEGVGWGPFLLFQAIDSGVFSMKATNEIGFAKTVRKGSPLIRSQS